MNRFNGRIYSLDLYLCFLKILNFASHLHFDPHEYWAAHPVLCIFTGSKTYFLAENQFLLIILRSYIYCLFRCNQIHCPYFCIFLPMSFIICFSFPKVFVFVLFQDHHLKISLSVIRDFP